MTLWSASWGSFRGRDHALRGVNRQDESLAFAEGLDAFGFVSDGCGAGGHSEVGARITVEVATRTAMDSRELALEDVPRAIVVEVVAALRATMCAIRPRNERAFIAEHLCATLLGFVVRGDAAVLIAVGDGVLRVDDEAFVLDAMARPAYPAYGILGDAPSIDVRLVRPVRSVGVATDGVSSASLLALAPRGENLARHLVLMERRGELFDDGAVAMVVRGSRGAS